MKPTIRRVGDLWEFQADNLLVRLPDREQVLALAWEHILETTTPTPVVGAAPGVPQDSPCAGTID